MRKLRIALRSACCCSVLNHVVFSCGFVKVSCTSAKRLQSVAFDGDLWVCVEVDQQSELAVRDAEVIENLPPVFVGESVSSIRYPSL